MFNKYYVLNNDCYIFGHLFLELVMKKLVISASLLAGTVVFAGGFKVSLQGVRQLAMAHTSAHAEDASITFFNPAGMSFIPSKLSVVAGGFGVASTIEYQNPITLENHKTNNPLGTPLYAAIAYKVVDEVSVGFSFATPFGSTVDWGEEWSGKDIVQKMQLKSFFFQPMVSVKLAPWVSLGGSYIYAKGSVDWDKAVTLLGGSLNIKDEKASGSGFGLGFYFQPDDNLNVSIAYRSPVDMKAENGKVSFNVAPSLYSVLGLDANGQDSFKATLPLVDEYTLAASYRITPKWKVAADFNYTGWDGYDKLTLDFENAKIGNHPSDPTVLVSDKNFKSTRTVRLGTEYKFNELITGRLGWYWDESPYADKDFIPETPSFNMNVLTAGVGFNLKSFGIDLAAARAFQQSRKFNNEQYNFSGQAKSKAYYFGLGIRYNLK